MNEENENTTTAEEETPTLEEQVATLTQQVTELNETVTALQELFLEIAGESEYELRYSGEQADELLDSGRAVFNFKSASVINSLIGRTFPLYLKWGSFTFSEKVNADNGNQSRWNTLTGYVPSDVTNPAVLMTCDWGKTVFKNTQFMYKVNGTNIDWKYYLEHTADQAGTYSFKVYYLIIGKRTGGGQIG
ncbi:MAG: hypothetical protein Q4E74_08010 [Ruminococcus sp.]|nr:hypothetical protein [Ruminococcus sp.]